MQPSTSGRRRPNPGEVAGDMSLDTAHELMMQGADRMLGGASKATRFVLRRIPGAPGLVYDVVRGLTSDEPLRTAAEIGGGMAGGELGSLVGAAAGGVNAPVGAVLGATAGSNLATDAYDDFYQGHKAQMDETNRWIVQRRKDFFGR